MAAKHVVALHLLRLVQASSLPLSKSKSSTFQSQVVAPLSCLQAAQNTCIGEAHELEGERMVCHAAGVRGRRAHAPPPQRGGRHVRAIGKVPDAARWQVQLRCRLCGLLWPMFVEWWVAGGAGGGRAVDLVAGMGCMWLLACGCAGCIARHAWRSSTLHPGSHKSCASIILGI